MTRRARGGSLTWNPERRFVQRGTVPRWRVRFGLDCLDLIALSAPSVITLDWLHIVALLGAAQGFFLTAVLATQRRNRTANRLLAVAVFAFSLQMLSVVYHAADLEPVFPHFFGAAYPLPLVFGPLIFLYAVTASDRARGLRRWDVLHFVPFVGVVIAGLPIYLMGGAEKVAFARALELGARPLLLMVVDPLKYASGISYTVVTIVFLQRHRALMKDSYSSLERVNLQWLLRLAAAGAGIWALAALFPLTEGLEYALLDRQDDIIALAIAVLVYGIGYMALRQPEIFRIPTGEYPILRTPVRPAGASAAAVPSASPGADQPSPRYERSGLTEREAASLKENLLAVMEREHPYRNSDLTLTDLASRLDTSPHKLSEVLNAQLDQTFYDFVNGYRIRDVQRRMAEEQSKNLTVLSLALDAGFASKSTFNQAFKKHTGQTPSVYRRSVGG